MSGKMKRVIRLINVTSLESSTINRVALYFRCDDGSLVVHKLQGVICRADLWQVADRDGGPVDIPEGIKRRVIEELYINDVEERWSCWKEGGERRYVYMIPDPHDHDFFRFIEGWIRDWLVDLRMERFAMEESVLKSCEGCQAGQQCPSGCQSRDTCVIVAS